MAAKPGELKVLWSKRDCDLMFEWGASGATSADGSWLNSWLCHHRGFESTFIEELKKRGYDVTSLRISVRRKT